jgi:GntR family transcriptional regulator, transcriptional repressor for pyruvate dehydrogenase complex
MPDDASGRALPEAAEWRPVTRSLTYQLVVEAVEAQILTGALKVGDHLPPERELASLLGVSRPAVREGLRMLEAQGVLQTVGAGPGSATVVTALPSEALTRLLRLHLALSSFRATDVVEARVMLERRSAELAAQNGTPADFDRIRAALDRMDDLALPMETFNELDTEFHVSLADASDNQLVADMTRAIRGAVRDALLEAFRARVMAGDGSPPAGRAPGGLRRGPVGRPDEGGGRGRAPHQGFLGRLASPDDRQGLLGDLQLLVRRHHQHRHRAALRRDRPRLS